MVYFLVSTKSTGGHVGLKNIVIIGGGNIGTLLLSDLASKDDLMVTMLTNKVELWSNEI